MSNQPKVDLSQFMSVMEGRSATYAFLSRLYEKEVDSRLLDQMCATKYPVSTGNENVNEANRRFASFLSKRWERTEEDLRIDYARTFFGNGLNGYEAAYPLESVHTSEERLMMQDARDEVLALYRAIGLERDEENKENEDHIAFELFYMKVLTDLCIEASKAHDDASVKDYLIRQYTFVNDHLLNWTPLLTSSMRHFSKSDFYIALSYLTDGFLESDEEFLGSLLDSMGVDSSSLKKVFLDEGEA